MPDNELTFFMVVGRLGKSLVVSKATPIIMSSKIKHLYIFSEVEGYPINGATYITLPRWLVRIKPNILKKLIRTIYEPLQLFQFAKKMRPTIIQGIYTLPKGLYSVIVAKIIGAKSIVSVIGGEREIITYLPFPKLWKRLNLWILRNCDSVTTKGESISQFLVGNKISNEKIYIFNGAIEQKFKLIVPIFRNIDIIFCGNFSTLKGPDRVVEIIQKLAHTRPLLKAVFIGAGKLFDSIQTYIHENCPSNIILLGHIPNPEIYFQRAKLQLIPSKSEGLSTAMLEGMACGCVPIVSNVGSMTEAAIHEENSMVVENYDDIDSFANFAEELLTNNHKWEILSKNGVLLVGEKYTKEAQSLILSEIFSFLNL